MNTIKKTISLGKVDGYQNGRKSCRVTLDLTLEPGHHYSEKRTVDLEPAPVGYASLSICGNVWNSQETDCITCGQIIDEVAGHFKGNKRVKRIVEIWRR